MKWFYGETGHRSEFKCMLILVEFGYVTRLTARHFLYIKRPSIVYVICVFIILYFKWDGTNSVLAIEFENYGVIITRRIFRAIAVEKGENLLE